MRPPARRLLALPCAVLTAAGAQAQYPLLQLLGDPADQLGFTLAGAGDADGDGRGDLAIGARHAAAAGVNSGALLLVSGADGAPLWRVDGAAPGEKLGSSVACVGDLDGDGRDDWIAGAPYASAASPLAGAARVHSGLDGALLHALVGTTQFDLFGSAVAGGGRIDGDGVDDFLVGAPNEDGGGVDSGVLHVYSGAGAIELFAPVGDAAGDLLGTAALVLGDVDQDGRAEFLAGAPRADLGGADAGLARVYSGATGLPLYTVLGNPGSELGAAVARLGDLDGDGFADFAAGARLDATAGLDAGRVALFSGADGAQIDELFGLPGSLFGAAVACAGDVDGDGVEDVLVGAPGEGPAGAAHLYSGASRGLLHSVAGVAPSGGFGRAAAGGLDLDADGHAEYAVGAPQDGSAGPSAGRVTIYGGVDPLGAAYCFGDGTGGVCPCGNAGAAGEGCANSGGAGATLAAAGSPSAAADDLGFAAAQLAPDQPALLFAGLNAVGGGQGVPFGDGLRCAGGSVVRLGTRTADGGGAASWGPGLVALGQLVPGETRRFQAWYRDPLGGPCGAGFNLSPGWELALLP